MMDKFSYLFVLLLVLLGCLWLEVVLRTRVFRRLIRLILAIVPAATIFLVWDAYAIASGHWWFDTDRILGWYLPGEIPVDELAFFIVIPIATILTIEAVFSVKPHWRVDKANSAKNMDLKKQEFFTQVSRKS